MSACQAKFLSNGQLDPCGCKRFVCSRHALMYCECGHSCENHGVKAKSISGFARLIVPAAIMAWFLIACAVQYFFRSPF